MIKIDNLFKAYNKNVVLKDFSIEFHKGKIYGIVGENGSGKTTLFRCISGLENYSGSIISEFQPIKNHLGFLITEPYFFSKITGEEYIRLLCNARKIEISDIDLSNIFNLPLSRYISQYSTGMKKKLAFLAIILQENKYFIFDEPFNGIDIQSNAMIKEIIIKLKSLNKTIIMSSHIFSTLNDVCDQIIYLGNENQIKVYEKSDFQLLETEMLNGIIKTKLSQLDLK